MKNRVVGIMIIGIAILIGLIIFSFNRAMTDIVNTSCTHGFACPMWGTIDFQTNASIAVMGFVIAIGLYLIFFGYEERIITRIKKINQQIELKNITIENYKDIMVNLDAEEKTVLEKIIEEKGSMLQSELVDKTGFQKVKITRILDKLEGRAIIERKRRGMTNIVILK